MEQQVSFQEYLIFLTSSPEGVWVIFVLSLIFVAGVKYFGQEFFRWLKGSRISHYLSTTPGYEEVYTTHPRYKLRTESQRMSFYKTKLGAIIEISHGFLRRRSAIYGEAAKNWRVASDRAWPNTLQWVYLQDIRGMRIEDALPLINTYPSLQSMLDRISELERDNWLSAKKYNDLNAALIAIYKHILDGKQRFRSQAAQEIRENLELILKETHCIYDGAVEKSWRTRFNRGKIPSGA